MEQFFQYLALNKIWFSLWQGMLTVIISFVIGAGCAYIENAKKIKPSSLFIIIMTLPVFLPGIIVATGFIAVWGNNGYINNMLQFLHVPAISWLYSPMSIIASHAYYNFPLFYLAIYSRLLVKDKNTEEIAAVIGASPWQIFKTITWPRTKNTVIACGLLVFLYSFLSFSLPLVLGGVKYQTLEVFIYHLITQQFNFSSAVLLSILQFALLLILMLFFLQRFQNFEEKKIDFFQLPEYKRSLPYSLVKIFLSAYIILPLAAIFIKSWPGQNFYKLFNNMVFLKSLARSLLLSLIVIIACLLLNLFILSRKKNYISRYLILFLAVSPVMLGIILRLYLGQSLVLLIAAYIFMLWPVNYYLLAASWRSKPKNFLETLQILGANKKDIIQASIHYLLPAIKKSAALSMVFVIGDLALASMLLPYQEKTAMVLCYSLLGSYRFSVASAGFSLILLTIIILIAIIYFYDFKNRKFKRFY